MTTATLRSTRLRSDVPAGGALGLAERGLVPDALVRLGIRRLCADRLLEERAGGLAVQSARRTRLIDMLRRAPVAIEPAAANTQHYEVPAAFFQHCLGPRLKYSCCYYPTGHESLAESEDAMLGLYADRAELADGQHILELGCGWGSLTLWMAQRYPDSRITAVSNSLSQRQYIEDRCRENGLSNVDVLTRDVNDLALDTGHFDRCVSIEMFEHMRNYQILMQRIASWLKPGGKLFVHIFAHRTLMYPFETSGPNNWMGRHFFTGGLMPATDTLLHFQQGLSIDQLWLVDGTHYEKTANHWLARQDNHHDAVMAVLREVHGERAALWFQRWRMFWMACAELFGYGGGQEWLVAHYRFVRS